MADNKKPSSKKIDPEEEKKRQQQVQRRMSFSVSYLLVGMVVLWLFQEFILTPMQVQATEIPYSEFKQKITDKQILDFFCSRFCFYSVTRSPVSNIYGFNLIFQCYKNISVIFIEFLKINMIDNFN